ncbi:MAG: altronate dehydratase family protein [Clostridia bacterium]|nr:altronate dehydratase family protein [Clostridia bacterium]
MIINFKDNVAVAVRALKKGEILDGVAVLEDVPFGHKAALKDIKKGEDIIKYGYPIGHAKRDIQKGEWVHSHCIETNLSDITEYDCYNGENRPDLLPCERMFKGYVRPDGRIGIRNEIWIIPTVGCVNSAAVQIARLANERYSQLCDGVFAFTHPYGCSQLGDDMKMTQKALAGLANHPNASGVLLLSLGCENNNLNEFLPQLGNYDKEAVRTLVIQDEGNETEKALEIIGELAERACKQKRVSVPLSKLTIGFKCGGSDGFSGITANPLCGKITDRHTSFGGKAILTEVPEMFGAETILMKRATNRSTFDKAVSMINNFKNYYIRHGQTIYENPSPGNKDGGITTLEEKSLGCVQKGGTAPVCDVLEYGEPCRSAGLNLLTGPGNDIVSCTNLTVSGANIILFTTGRGTPLGAPVPTLKISTNSDLATRKPNWIDFDAGRLLSGISLDELADELTEKIIRIASGEETTKNEQNGYREIAIFKDGVTL